MATITVEIRYADRPSEVRSFAQAKVTIGRESGDIVLGDPAASGQHAEINVTATNVTYVDLNSTNGSFLPDGQRIAVPIALQAGSVVRIGGSAIVLREFVAGGARYGAKGTLVMSEQPEPAAAAPAKMESLRASSGVAPSGLAFDDTVNPNQVSPFHAGVAPPPAFSSPMGAPPQHPGAPPQQYGAPPPQQYGGPPQYPGAPPQQQYGAPPQQQYGAPPPQYPGAPAVGAPPQYPGAPPMAPPGQYAGAGGGMGRPLALAGGAASLEPGAFLSSAFEIYKPHALEATKVLGIVAIPVALLNAAAIPLGLGGLLSLLGAIAVGLFNLLVGMGALGEFTMRLAAGVPMTAPQALKLQVGRIFPWLLGILLPAFLAGLGAICLIPLILFGFFLIQVYMVERDKSGIDINKRVFELVQKEPVMVAVVLGIAIAVGLVFGLASFILGLLPYVGAPAAALLSGVFTAAFSPIIYFLGFRLYFAIRQKHENVDAAAVARSQLTPVT